MEVGIGWSNLIAAVVVLLVNLGTNFNVLLAGWRLLKKVFDGMRKIS